MLRLNADGFMMTRSLAENYPYSPLYKAAIRGAKDEWVKIVDWIEEKEMPSESALKQLIIFLNSRSEDFQKRVNDTLQSVRKYIDSKPSFQQVFELVKEFVDASTYSARIFEIAIHSLFQVFEKSKVLEGYLKPISQMRSANKKHGNIGDIEVSATKDNLDILEAWDAKYGKTYLRDELEEINEKLIHHPQCKIAGFICDSSPNLKREISERIDELGIIHGVEIEIADFSSWVSDQIKRFDLKPNEVGMNWLFAIAESICQMRREIAPIDEPTGEWVKFFGEKLNEKLK